MDKQSRSLDPQGSHIECYGYHSNYIKLLVTQSVTLSCVLIIHMILYSHNDVIQFICWILTCHVVCTFGRISRRVGCNLEL